MINSVPRHQSAFAGRIVELLHLQSGDNLLDLTLGDGGHTQEALEAGVKVVSLDIDPESIQRATSFIPDRFSPLIVNVQQQLDSLPEFTWLIINANMKQIGSLVKSLQLPLFNAILADLGPSQYQILSPQRGFSFQTDQPLDMRLDPNLQVTAADLLRALGKKELIKLFSLVDEPEANRLASAIVNTKKEQPLTTTQQLSDLVSRIKKQKTSVHPATKVFMALRMAVNLEREVIQDTLPQLPALLTPQGHLGVISFHSGEDRLVKNFSRQAENHSLRVTTKKPLVPDSQELIINPRVRSAKLRILQKIT